MRINVAPMNNICPETMVPTMPFLFRSKEHMRKVLDGPIGDEILKACETQGFIGLAFYDSGSRSLYTVKKPVKTLADVKGMKIRVQQSDLWVALLQAMGANATPMPYGEVYTALKTGRRRRRREQLAVVRHVAPLRGRQVLLDHRALDGAGDAADVEEGLGHADARTSRRSSATRRRSRCPTCASCGTRRSSKSRAMVEAGGAQVVEVDKKSFQDAMKPVYDKFITDPKLKDMVQKVQATQ